MTIREFSIEDLESLSYELDEIQKHFTRTPAYCIYERKDLENPDFVPITILFEDEPIGFFILDFGKDCQEISENSSSVLLRSLSLNPKFQGRGIAKKAMMDVVDFLKTDFRKIDKIVLTVNFKNENAYHLYRKCGFLDTGKVCDGRAGKQHILEKKV